MKEKKTFKKILKEAPVDIAGFAAGVITVTYTSKQFSKIIPGNTVIGGIANMGISIYAGVVASDVTKSLLRGEL